MVVHSEYRGDKGLKRSGERTPPCGTRTLQIRGSEPSELKETYLFKVIKFIKFIMTGLVFRFLSCLLNMLRRTLLNAPLMSIEIASVLCDLEKPL